MSAGHTPAAPARTPSAAPDSSLPDSAAEIASTGSQGVPDPVAHSIVLRVGPLDFVLWALLITFVVYVVPVRVQRWLRGRARVAQRGAPNTERKGQ